MSDSYENYKDYIDQEAIDQLTVIKAYYSIIKNFTDVYAIVSEKIIKDGKEYYDDPIIFYDEKDLDMFTKRNSGMYVIVLPNAQGFGIFEVPNYYQKLRFKKVQTNNFKSLFQTSVLN